MIGGSPRILIIRLSAIGDVVRVLPALHVLRSSYPDAQIDWAVEKKSAAILEGHPALDSLLIFERSPKWTQAAKEFLIFCQRIRQMRYDVVLDFHGIFKSGLAARVSGARSRFGFAWPRGQEGSSLFVNKKVWLPEKTLNRTEENLRLCEAYVPNCPWPSVTIYVPPDVQDAVDVFFDSAFDSHKQVVAMHVPVDRPEKRWPYEHMAALSDMLQADGRFDVLLTWGPNQLDTVQQVLEHTRRKPVVAPETANLKHYAWLVHRAALYFGGDTGPMHIAAAMGTPVVAVFGGTDPVRHAPYRVPNTALYAGGRDQTDAQAILRAITPEMAYEACVKQLFT